MGSNDPATLIELRESVAAALFRRFRREQNEMLGYCSSVHSTRHAKERGRIRVEILRDILEFMGDRYGISPD